MSTELDTRVKQEVSTTATEKLSNSGPAFSPDVNIYVSDEEAIFLIDLPGVKKGDVTIEVDESQSLIIRGTNTYTPPANPVFRQYQTGNYYRSFQLSDDYDKERISAKQENGLLEITIPKKEEAKPRRIEIKA